MRNSKVFVAALFLLSSASALADESTQERNISMIGVDGRPAVTYYFKADAGWGSASCPSAHFVYTREVEGQKELLAAALAAVAAGKQVYFIGTCDAGSDYFLANRIWVKQ